MTAPQSRPDGRYLCCGREFSGLPAWRSHRSHHDREWPTTEERFWSQVTKGPGCWEWKGAVSDTGYGNLVDSGRPVSGHRYSWQLHVGPIPADLHVCHHCDNRRCVRPDHLFLGTRSDNMRDAVAKGRHFTPFRRGTSDVAAQGR